MMDKESKKELFFILSFGVSSRLPVRCVSFIMNTDLMSWSYGFFKIVSNRRSFCSLRKRERERERDGPLRPPLAERSFTVYLQGRKEGKSLVFL